MRGGTFAVLFLFGIATSLYATSNLTSCVGCSQVTCPPGAICHNIGSCPNGFVLWGCEYPNGTVISSTPPSVSVNTTTTVAPTTTIQTTSVMVSNTTSIISIPTTVVPIKTTGNGATGLELTAVVMAIVIIALAYYILVARKK